MGARRRPPTLHALLQRKRPLLRYGVQEFATDKQALEFCEASFHRVRRFRFIRAENNLLSTAGSDFAGCRIATVYSTGHEISLDEDDGFALLLPIRGTLAVRACGTEMVANPGEMLAAGTLARTTTLSQDYLGVLVRTPTGEIARRLQSRGLRSAMSSLMSVADETDAGFGSTLRSYVLHLLDELDRRQTLCESEDAALSAVRLLQDFIVQWQADVQEREAGSARSAPASPVSLRRAEEFVRTNCTQALSLDEIAGTAGVSVRSLQQAFRRYRRTTPHAFLNQCRLERARQRLLAASPQDSVASIARECGFIHLGRFAAVYARAFGERPSSTLKRATG